MKNRIISFSGVDGSGKTTYAAKVRSYLEQRGEKVVLLNVYQLSIFLTMGKILKVLGIKEKDDTLSEGKKEPGVSIFCRNVCMFLDIAVFAIIYAVLGSLGVYIVCDRYLYDTAAHISYKGKKAWDFADFFLKIMPRPRVPFLLTVDPATAQLRENAHATSGYFCDKAKIYEDFSSKVGFCHIGTDESVSSCWEIIKKKVDSDIP